VFDTNPSAVRPSRCKQASLRSALAETPDCRRPCSSSHILNRRQRDRQWSSLCALTNKVTATGNVGTEYFKRGNTGLGRSKGGRIGRRGRKDE
ncbi:hypothetical protein CSHISOI_09031, partial [Colletotrichum shisoi]